MRSILRSALSPLIAVTFPLSAFAQEPARSLDLTLGGNGISIGHSRRVNGLRINFRDTRLEQVNGVNITLWTPMRSSGGTVNGAAIGLPMTGADEINGLAVGIFGFGAEERFRGIGIGGVGAGGGGL